MHLLRQYAGSAYWRAMPLGTVRNCKLFHALEGTKVFRLTDLAVMVWLRRARSNAQLRFWKPQDSDKS